VATLSPMQIGAIGLATGWAGELDWFIAMSLAESSGRTDAIGRDGHDFGLTQTRDVHRDIAPPGYFPPGTGWKNPIANAMLARKIYTIQGKGAWSPSASGQNNPDIKIKARIGAAQAKASAAGQALPTRTGDAKSNTAWEVFLAGLGIAGATLNIPGVDGGDLSINTETGVVDGSIETSNPLDPSNLIKGLGPMLWIGGGALLVVLGVVLLAKDVAPVGKILKGMK
jgi:hypothetical protein